MPSVGSKRKPALMLSRMLLLLSPRVFASGSPAKISCTASAIAAALDLFAATIPLRLLGQGERQNGHLFEESFGRCRRARRGRGACFPGKPKAVLFRPGLDRRALENGNAVTPPADHLVGHLGQKPPRHAFNVRSEGCFRQATLIVCDGPLAAAEIRCIYQRPRLRRAPRP